MSATSLNLRVEDLDSRVACSKAPRSFKTDWAIWRGRWAEAFRTAGDALPVNKLQQAEGEFAGWLGRFQTGDKDSGPSSGVSGLTLAGIFAALVVGGVAVAAVESDDDEEQEEGGEAQG